MFQQYYSEGRRRPEYKTFCNLHSTMTNTVQASRAAAAAALVLCLHRRSSGTCRLSMF